VQNWLKEIKNCKYINFNDGTDNKYIQATIDGVVSSVPINEMNMDYAQIKRQVDAGELTIEDAD
tara:strand:+ start:447 stop:638 length:192 start_codon:yes stop_codon:yes gene_type:complete